MDQSSDSLTVLAKQIMRSRGLEPEFSGAVLQELSKINEPAQNSPKCMDLRSLLWCSIDNDDSRDLDQLTYGEKSQDNKTIIWIAVADVDALVHKDSAIDLHAQKNTTSVYTPSKIFPMLPEKLSTNLTSLNENEDRLAIVVKIIMNQVGGIEDFSIMQALVHNYAQLTYNAIGEWLNGSGNLPDKVKNVKGLESSLRWQHEAAQVLKNKRHELGSLTLESSEVRAKVSDKQEIILSLAPHNYAHQLIEEFMIAANFCIVQQFNKAKIASFRRVVRQPKRWNRIVELASKLGDKLPEQPDSKALNQFLVNQRKLDPVAFPDLSLSIIKLLGRGEYIVENVGDESIGHFGLALSDYTHATAPNRRFPDLITQRQYKAYLQGVKGPYSLRELNLLADHCTQQEDAAAKVERHINKSAAAMLLSSQIGTIFNGIITGASQKGTWVRIFQPAVEGKVIQGFERLDVGDRVSVKLEYVDIPKGFIDFSVYAKKP